MIFKNAIVRKPCENLISGLTSADLGKPDYSKALVQHARYVQALQTCGVEVRVLNSDDAYPDSTFVEDVALLTPRCAIIMRPGAKTRRGETKGISPVIEEYYSNIEQIVAPGTLEAGDIMMVEDHYYIGLSTRTNVEGAEQLIQLLKQFDYTASIVNMQDMLHLKTGLAYLQNNVLLAFGEFLTKPEFRRFNIIEIPEEESYAANSIWVNGAVLIPAANPISKALIQTAGYKLIEVEVSEFRKLNGGLSCLSLRF